jgi:hypothetical protein
MLKTSRWIGLLLLPLGCSTVLWIVFSGGVDFMLLGANFLFIAVPAHLLIGLFIASLPQDEETHKYDQQSFLATLVASGIFLPGFLSLTTTVAYLGGGSDQEPPVALIEGSVTAVWSWFVFSFACRNLARADTAIPSAYGELSQRLTQLTTRLQGLHPGELIDTPEKLPADLKKDVPFNEANDQRLKIVKDLREPGLKWVTASGYNDAWNCQYRAEESTIEISANTGQLQGALYDDLRLQDSSIEAGLALRTMLSTAVNAISKDAAAYLPSRGSLLAEDGKDPTPPSQPVAYGVLRTVRRSINEYRGQRWNGLIVARNRLLATMFLTESAAYALLVLALFFRASTDEILAASVYFVVGAAIGLLGRLRTESQTESAVEDYGLSASRLLTIPLLSGLTALGGVVLTTIVSDSTARNATPHALNELFQLNGNLTSLVTAAVFGLTPGLLFDRLGKAAEKYKSDLKSSEATEERKKG